MAPFDSKPPKSGSGSSKAHSHRTRTEYIRITFENLCGALEDDMYTPGIDPTSMQKCLIDLFNYITVDKDMRIVLPASVDEPTEARIMWGEGATVRSRAGSVSSRTSNSVRTPLAPMSRQNSYFDRASSVISGSTNRSTASRFVGFADEETQPMQFNSRRQSSAPSTRAPAQSNPNPVGTIKVGGAVVPPTKSLENLFAQFGFHRNEEPEPEPERAQTNVRRPQYIPEPAPEPEQLAPRRSISRRARFADED